jgi:hypothetical protein
LQTPDGSVKMSDIYISCYNVESVKTFEPKHTSIISREAKHISCLNEARRGIAAVIHEPAIEPTVRLYLLESFNLNEMTSHWSTSKTLHSVWTKEPTSQQGSQNMIDSTPYKSYCSVA